MNGTSAVALSNVTKSFPQSYKFWDWVKHRGHVPQRRALTDVSFTVERGEIFGLLGANGAGKTTLLKLMATIALPDRGTIRIDGVDVLQSPLRARRSLGFAQADDRGFYYRLSARANLRYFGTLCDVPPKRLDERIQMVAEVVDLERDLDRRFSQYSPGMRQRLSIARALLTDPPVVLMDEPTHAVDPIHSDAIRRFIRERLANEGKTVILATNLIEEAWELCDRVAVIGHGRILAVDAPANLRNRFTRLQRYQVFFDRCDASLLERISNAAGVRHAEADPADDRAITVELADETTSLNAFLQAASCNGIAVRRIEPIDLNPVEVFTSLIEADS